MNRKMTLAILALSLTLIFTVAMSAQNGVDEPESTESEVAEYEPAEFDAPFGPRGNRGGKPRLLEFKEKLGITDEQVDKLQATKTAHQKAMIELGSTLKIALIDMKELMAGNGNDAAVLNKSKEISDIKATMGEMKTKHQLTIRSIFTPEQWEKVGKLRNFTSQRRTIGKKMNSINRGAGRFYDRSGMNSRGRRGGRF